jgi:hypothetical protein
MLARFPPWRAVRLLRPPATSSLDDRDWIKTLRLPQRVTRSRSGLGEWHVRSYLNCGRAKTSIATPASGHFRTRAPQQIRRRVAHRDGDGEFSTVTILGEIRSDAVLDAAYATKRRSGCGSALSPRLVTRPTKCDRTKQGSCPAPGGQGENARGGGGSLSSVHNHTLVAPSNLRSEPTSTRRRRPIMIVLRAPP